MTDEEYLSPAQVADQLKVTTVTVRRWITSGQLQAAKAGPRKWRILRSDLVRFLAASASAEAAQASEDPSFRRHLVAPDDG
jgi:excisionase family DNA binding protein